MGVGKDFYKRKSQGSALVSRLNIGGGVALNGLPTWGGVVAVIDWVVWAFEFSAYIQKTQLAEVLFQSHRLGGNLGGLEANGAQVPILLHTQVHQVDTEPPCQYSGVAQDFEYCVGASGWQSEVGVGVLGLDVLGSKLLDMSDLSTSK